MVRINWIALQRKDFVLFCILKKKKENEARKNCIEKSKLALVLIQLIRICQGANSSGGVPKHQSLVRCLNYEHTLMDLQESILTIEDCKRYQRFQGAPQHSGFVCAFRLVVRGSNPKHTLYVFPIYGIIFVTVLRKRKEISKKRSGLKIKFAPFSAKLVGKRGTYIWHAFG